MHQSRPGLDDLAAARAPGHPHLRHRLRLREPARHRPLLPHPVPRRGVPEDDGHGRVPPPGRQVPGRPRGRDRPHAARSLLAAAYRCGVPIFTSSPGDSSIGMNLAALQLEGSAAAHRPAARRQPDGRHRLRRQEERAAAACSSSAAARRRTSCCRPSRRSRRCSAWTRAATTTSCRSPTPAPTPAASAAPRRRRR